MKFLRTAPTRHLTTALAGLLVVLLAGTAIALAAAGSGPVPAPKPLPRAIHDALAAPQVPGITARISFTNHLVPSTDLGGEGSAADPLLNGGSGRLWLSPATHQLRLELQGDTGDAQIVVNGRTFWAYDPRGKTVYEGTLPTDRHPASARDAIPTLAQITKHLSRARSHLRISGAQPTDVAGQPAYAVHVSPRAHPGLLGNVGFAWDALHGTPLRLTVTARGSSSPVIELTATGISFGAVPASVFQMPPPAGVKVAHVALPAHEARRHDKHHSAGRVTSTGEGLDSIAVIREPAARQKGSAPGAVNLPTVKVNGIIAQELDTPLGTLIRFTRGATTYTVIGSRPPGTVLAAARRL